jgi:hypothetical protein
MIAIAIVVATIASYVPGWFSGKPGLIPIFNTAASFPFMVLALRARNVKLAIARMLVWAATMGVCATALSYVYPLPTNRLFLRGADYRNEMFEWVRTGNGAESSPSVFIPAQARDAAIFSALALATGGVVAMTMGAVLMNQMGHYVGALAAWSAHPAATMILGWHPWAVIRIASFVVIGVVLSIPVLSRVIGFTADWRSAARTYLPWALGGLVADIVLKALLAPAWQRLLLRIVGW